MSFLHSKSKYVGVIVATIIAMFLSFYGYNNYQIQRKFEKSYEIFKTLDSIDVVRLSPLAEDGHGMSNVLMGAYYLKMKDTVNAMKYFNDAVQYGEKTYGSFGLSIVNTAEHRRLN